MLILSKRLKLLRKERKMTQKNLADYLGITDRAYQYYESETDKAHCPDLNTLILLADLFDVSIDYLAGRTDERKYR